jgi:hypothetical protein
LEIFKKVRLKRCWIITNLIITISFARIALPWQKVIILLREELFEVEKWKRK